MTAAARQAGRQTGRERERLLVRVVTAAASPRLLFIFDPTKESRFGFDIGQGVRTVQLTEFMSHDMSRCVPKCCIVRVLK